MLHILYLSTGNLSAWCDYITELSLLSARVQLSTTVSDLGVLVDGQLSMADHVASLRRSCFFSVAPASTCGVVTD